MNAETQTGNGNKSSAYAPVPTSREEKIEGRLNGDILTSIIVETEARGGAGVFKIENGGQLWEVAKMMALSGPAVAHPLRGKPYLCFAVAQQAQRWRMDPFAVGSKAYVTKSKDKETNEIIERIAYEAQLVNAVINTNAPIKTRPSVKWERMKADDPDSLTCTVSATFTNEDEPKSLTSPSVAGIQPKNSPLWKTAPNIQIAYWTLRAWARLYCPEVLLGVYTPDEMENDEIDLVDTTSSPTPSRPTREQFVERIFREQLHEPGTGDDSMNASHDPETGEIIENKESAKSPDGTTADAGHASAQSSPGTRADDGGVLSGSAPSEAVTDGAFEIRMGACKTHDELRELYWHTAEGKAFMVKDEKTAAAAYNREWERIKGTKK